MGYRLEELCKIGSSKRIYLSEYTKSGIPFYRGKEIIEKSNGKKISSQLFISLEKYEEIKSKFSVPKIGDILISAVGTLGKSWFVDEEKFYFKDGNLIWLYDFNNEIINNRFLNYKLKSKWFENIIDGISIGSTQKAITIEQLKKVELDVPDIKLQNKIVKILDGISIKIELNNQINDNLYKIIKTEYDKSINELTEYDLVKLKDIANISSGKRPKIKGTEFDIPLIGASGVMSYTDNYNFNEDILIIGRVGTLGVVQRYFDKIWASDNTLTIKTVYSSSVECYLKNVDYISLNRGSTQPLITQTDISNLEIKFNKVEFEKFENNIRPIRDKIYQNELQNKTLEQIRDTVLPKLMNGEIDLDKIEI